MRAVFLFLFLFFIFCFEAFGLYSSYRKKREENQIKDGDKFIYFLNVSTQKSLYLTRAQRMIQKGVQGPENRKEGQGAWGTGVVPAKGTPTLKSVFENS